MPYKTGVSNFTADFLSRLSKKVGALAEAENDESIVLKVEEGPADLELFLIDVSKKLSGILPNGNKVNSKEGTNLHEELFHIE